MSKKETFIFRFFGILIVCAPLYGDIAVGILKSIDDNTKVHLLYNNIPISCEPFGIIPLEKISPNAPSPEECSSRIEKFYRSSPHDKVFAKEHFKIHQSYHFELIESGCVLYANGLETYSEMLISQGLAIMDPKFENNEWSGRLNRVQKGAEKRQMGIFKEELREFCIKEEK